MKRVLAESNVPAQNLVVEITESAAMTDPEMTRKRLQDMRELGVRVAIDDFGMGYSSLAYLKKFPADHIKIDRAFTRGIGQHHRDEEVIDLVLELAAKWNLEVIAEGVETREQLDWLTSRGCARAQGYLIGKPVEPADFVRSVISQTVDVDGEPISYRGLRMVTSNTGTTPSIPDSETAT
jgi:EAL domain-containing protein (putative c-di-GMP-specific phosphodiesterase class I)